METFQSAGDVGGFNLALGDLQNQQSVTLKGGKASGIGAENGVSSFSVQ